jgi:hypothetical protein
MEEFLSKVDERGMDQRIWSSICRRLRCELSDQALPGSRFYGQSYPYVEGYEFEGIIHALTAKCGGNVHEKGVVNITSSSVGCRESFKVANHEWSFRWNGFWQSDNEANSWICFDFKERRIALSHYTLKSGGSGDYHLVAWALEGSEDGANWTSLDARNTQELNGRYIVKIFGCSNKDSSKLFRYLRLRQTAENSDGCHFMQLGGIEFFGRLGEAESARRSIA